MFNTKAKTAGLILGAAAIFGFQSWKFVSANNMTQSQLTGLQQEIQSVRADDAARLNDVSANLQVVSEKMGITLKDLADARKAADVLKQDQARTAARFRTEMETHTKAVDDLREESNVKLTELSQGQSETINQIGAVSGDVKTVRTDLNATKSDLASSRKEMGDLRDSLGREIARNSSELAELRRRGERDYVEFDIAKTKTPQRVVTGVQVLLKKTDPKAQKYDISMKIDDNTIDKKGLPVKEPIQFMVGPDHLRYELVVYSVDKDRIRGYVSTPKDTTLSAEGPHTK